MGAGLDTGNSVVTGLSGANAAPGPSLRITVYPRGRAKYTTCTLQFTPGALGMVWFLYHGLFLKDFDTARRGGDVGRNWFPLVSDVT